MLQAQFTAHGPGGASISLTNGTTSFFDQYLDEIVYFFEKTKVEVVILEDIDRFQNTHIFEELSALNELLNSARGMRPVRFIYAVRDSIFDRSVIGGNPGDNISDGNVASAEKIGGAAQCSMTGSEVMESPAASRTKFFDLVIPVVPFITHKNARDLMRGSLSDVGFDIPTGLVDLTARHITDMRLIKNIRNEFVVFAQRILAQTDKSNPLNLRPDLLFAMMIYKSTHLSDFERIRSGTSTLDRLYDASRQFVNQNIRLCRATLNETQRVNSLREAVHDRVTHYAHLAQKYLFRLVEQIGDSNRKRISIEIPGSELDPAGLEAGDLEFWMRYLEERPDVCLDVQARSNHTRQDARTHVHVSYADMENALGLPKDPQIWADTDTENLREKIAQLNDDIEFLQQADFSELIRNDALQFLEGVFSGQKFGDVARTLLQTPLAFEMTEAGYITRDFTLYTTNFYGQSLSAAATNFVMHHVNRNKMDAHFELTAEDVDQLAAELDASAFVLPALFNINIVDALLVTHGMPIKNLLASLAKLTPEAREFLELYWGVGKRDEELVRRLTPLSSGIFCYLTESVALNDVDKARLLGVGLEAASTRINYATSKQFAAWWHTHASETPALQNDNSSETLVHNVARLFKSANVQLADIGTPISPAIRKCLAEAGCFEVNRKNLLAISAQNNVPGLDELGLFVYKRCIQHASGYMSSLQDSEFSVSKDGDLVSVLEDLVEQSSEYADPIAELSHPECAVQQVNGLTDQILRFLGHNGRIKLTVENVMAYLNAFGRVEGGLRSALESERVIDCSEVEESQKVELAKLLLADDNGIDDPELKSALVASLRLKDWLPVSHVPSIPGRLLGLLIRDNVIADSAETFAAMVNPDLGWETREFAIAQSTSFEEMITPDLLPPTDFRQAIRSPMVSDGVKAKIATELLTHAPADEPTTSREIANYALINRLQLTPEQVKLLTQQGAGADAVIPLLAPHLSSLDESDITQLLSCLGAPYEQLTSRTGKKIRINRASDAERSLLNRLQVLRLIRRFSKARGKEAFDIWLEKP